MMNHVFLLKENSTTKNVMIIKNRIVIKEESFQIEIAKRIMKIEN